MKNYYLNIYNDEFEFLIKRIQKSISKNKKEFIITANSEIIMSARNSKVIDSMLKNKDNLILADGISVIKTAKYFNINIIQKIAGVELCEELLNYSQANNLKVFIYGSAENTLDKLKLKYHKINFVGIYNGYDNKEDDIKKYIIKTEPDIIIIAMGVPRQELIINDVYSKAKKGIFIGVGGSLDVISGVKKRSPIIFRRLNLEWLYRLLKEPKRIKRFFNNNIKLLFIAKKESKK